MSKDKPFYIWWISNLLLASALFWVGYNGILLEVWQKDLTYLTSILGILLIYTVTYTGILAHNIHDLNAKVRSKMIGRSFFLSETAMALAILGASAAIIILLRVGAADVDMANLPKLLVDKWSELGPAFYPNFVGLAVALYIKVQTYFIAEDYLDE